MYGVNFISHLAKCKLDIKSVSTYITIASRFCIGGVAHVFRQHE